MAVNGNEITMQPVAAKFFIKSSLALGDFVTVMNWDMINTAGVYINRLTQFFMDNSGAF